MAEYEKKVRQVLSDNGCYFVRHGGRGDHDIWHSPINNRNFTVDGKINIRHVANAIMKQAGINYHF
ncbi:MAG: type II toxin-antitoxin system HicA family toxin [Treponema sp.]|jgi:predicted RNA binding protein YcfA (HicA-like mRNA interferase family)|nr:type II toxin-antitoxin system HicA family toxin [Treponema sp.]